MIFSNISIIILFTSWLAILMAIEQLIWRKRVRLNYIFSALMICAGIILWDLWAIYNRIYIEYPISDYLSTPSLLLLGPLSLMFYYSLLYPHDSLAYKISFHVIPACIIFIIDTFIYIQPWISHKLIINYIYANPLHNIIALSSIVFSSHLIIYIAYLIKTIFPLLKNNKIATGIRIILVTNTTLIFAAILILIGFLLKISLALLAGGIIGSVIVIGVFLVYNKYEDFFKSFQTAILKNKYKYSLLVGLDETIIRNRLKELLVIDKIYTDFELNINKLAMYLNLSTHQLSQFLNMNMEMDFRNYINSHRVKEAKKLIKEEPSKSIITICFQVGFNSKSAFNSSFKKFTGTTPTQYRYNIEETAIYK